MGKFRGSEKDYYYLDSTKRSRQRKSHFFPLQWGRLWHNPFQQRIGRKRCHPPDVPAARGTAADAGSPPRHRRLLVPGASRLPQPPRASRSEPYNYFCCKRPLRSSSPTANLTLPSPPLNRVPKPRVYTSFKYLQRTEFATNHARIH